VDAELSLGVDIAAAYQHKNLGPIHKGVVGFAPCFNATPEYPQLRSAVLKLARLVASRETAFDHVRLLALNQRRNTGDLGLVRNAYADLKAFHVPVDVVTYDSNGPAYVWESLQSVEALITYRLHGAIPAMLAEVPFALVEYHRKCSDFLTDVDQHEALHLKATREVDGRLRDVFDYIRFGTPATIDGASYRAKATASIDRALSTVRDLAAP
jgi:polysaccharide pyruvyl transferase WcaK-like protein